MKQANGMILVTAGIGFIGRVLVRHPAPAGYPVRVSIRGPIAALDDRSVAL